MRVSRVRFCLGCLLLATVAGCNGPRPTSPKLQNGPSTAAAIPETYKAFTGVYDLTMAVESSDPAWGDLTGYRYLGVLALADGAGSYSDMRVLNAAGGTVPSSPAAGSVTRGVDPARTQLNLEAGTAAGITLVVQSVGEPVPGQAASIRFTGRFGAAGHISGTFLATRRP